MRDFSWNVFTKTGDVESYLLYKEFDESDRLDELPEDEEDASGPIV